MIEHNDASAYDNDGSRKRDQAFDDVLLFDGALEGAHFRFACRICNQGQQDECECRRANSAPYTGRTGPDEHEQRNEQLGGGAELGNIDRGQSSAARCHEINRA